MTGATMEAKKHALRQTQEGSWILTLNIHPSDMPPWLLTAAMGQRLGVVVAPLHDEKNAEQAAQSGRPDPSPAPIAPRSPGVAGKPDGAGPALPKVKKRWADMNITTRAGILCSDDRSWPVIERLYNGKFKYDCEICVTDEQIAVTALHMICGVQSRKDILPDTPALGRFQMIESEYFAAIGRIPAP